MCGTLQYTYNLFIEKCVCKNSFSRAHVTGSTLNIFKYLYLLFKGKETIVLYNMYTSMVTINNTSRKVLRRFAAHKENDVNKQVSASEPLIEYTQLSME